MVFQSYALFPHLNVEENIVFGLKVRKVPAGERAQRLARVVDIVGLTEVLEGSPASSLAGSANALPWHARSLLKTISA